MKDQRVRFKIKLLFTYEIMFSARKRIYLCLVLWCSLRWFRQNYFQAVIPTLLKKLFSSKINMISHYKISTAWNSRQAYIAMINSKINSLVPKVFRKTLSPGWVYQNPEHYVHCNLNETLQIRTIKFFITKRNFVDKLMQKAIQLRRLFFQENFTN